MKQRGRGNNIRQSIPGVLAVAGLLSAGIVGSTPVRADVHSYASQKRQIRACVLTSGLAANYATPQEWNATPNVFYVLDRRSDLKPAGWEFVNPIAPATISGDIVARWTKRGGASELATGNTLAAQQFRIGAPMTKNLGAYWEVDLDAVSTDDLQQFDVALLSVHGATIGFTPDEREKLRRFVDAGGTLWINDEGGFDINSANAPFLFDLRFNAGSVDTVRPTLATSRHPLVNFPYPISAIDARNIGAYVRGGRNAHQNSNNGYVATSFMNPILFAGTQEYASAGDLGAGHVVITTGVAGDVNNFVGGYRITGQGGNSGVVSGDNVVSVPGTDLQFAYNLIAWTSSVPTSQGNSRRTAANAENMGSELGPKFATVPITTGSGNVGANPGSGAVMHKGAIFYVDALNVLHAYDANPAGDLDGDGNPDDGITDFSLGTPYDELWKVDLKSVDVGGAQPAATVRISTPTIVSYYDTTAGKTVDLVCVTTTFGGTAAFTAFPIRNNAGGIATAAGTRVWGYGLNTNFDVGQQIGFGEGTGVHLTPSPAPAFSEGILFVPVATQPGSNSSPWRIAALLPNGQNLFGNGVAAPYPGGATPVGGFPPIIGPLTVGYVRDEATGALDKMVYVPCISADYSATGSNPATAEIRGVHFSTRNEPLNALDTNRTTFRPTGERARLPWFAPATATNPLNAYLPVVYKITRNNAGLVTDSVRLNYINDFTVEFKGPPDNRLITVRTATALVDDDTTNRHESLTADYTLNWPDSAFSADAAPSNVELAQFATRRRFIAHNPNPNSVAISFSGNPALSSQDLLIFGAGDYPSTASGFSNANPSPAGDRIYAVLDQFAAQATATGAGRPRSGSEIAWMFAPSYGGDFGDLSVPPRLQNMKLASGAFQEPAINGDSIYDYETVGSPAISGDTVYTVGYGHIHTGGNNQTNAMIVMALRANPDMNLTIPPNEIADAERLAGYDPTVNPNATPPAIRLQQIDTEASTTANPRVISLQENTNFTVDRQTGATHVFNLRDPNGTNSFNTMLPIRVIVGSTTLGTILKDPTTGYGPLDNLQWYTLIPDTITGSGNCLPSSGPTVIGTTLYFGTDNGYIVSVNLKGGAGQVPTGAGTSEALVQAVPAMVNATNGAVVAQKIVHPPLGTTGILAVGTPQGLSALDNQLTLIADSQRLLEVTHSGDAYWSLDATKTLSVAGGNLVDNNGNTGTGQVITTKVSLARPNLARRTSLNGFLVADTGNNRVAQMDKGGNITWELHTLNNGLRMLRPGDPLALNHPTDVSTTTDTYFDTGAKFTIRSPVTNAIYTYTGAYTTYHYFIADSGNNRAVEVVDMYDGNGNPVVLTNTADNTDRVEMYRQLVFVTRSSGEQNLRYRYHTIQQFTFGASSFLLTSVSNVRAGALDPGAAAVNSNGTSVESPGGSLLVINRELTPGPNVQVNATNNDGNTYRIINTLAIPTGGGNFRYQAISNPSWFQGYILPDPANPNNRVLHCLLADDNGCYSLIFAPGSNDKAITVEWMLTGDEYYVMTGRRLRASSVQRLTQSDYDATTNRFYPHYLITNKYTGSDNVAVAFTSNVRPGQVHGEVVEVRGVDYYRDGYTNHRLYRVNGGNLQTNPNSAIIWMVPKETLPQANVNGPITRRIGKTNDATSTFLLEEPTFSDRPF